MSAIFQKREMGNGIEKMSVVKLFSKCFMASKTVRILTCQEAEQH